jgi:hypothetical protein
MKTFQITYTVGRHWWGHTRIWTTDWIATTEDEAKDFFNKYYPLARLKSISLINH